MWKRSEVERLTGLERHVIQNLCNKNTSRDGLGFWEPAVIKPGYSRFDEGDLLAFYLVRQLVKAGFRQAEVGSVVFEMTEQGDGFANALRSCMRARHCRLKEVAAQLETLERLERAASFSPDGRLREIMRAELRASADRAIGEAGVVSACDRARLLEAVDKLSDAIWGDVACAVAFEPLARCVQRLGRAHIAPESDEAWESLVSAAGEFGRALGASEPLARAMSLFLGDVDNGVPIELVLGKGSFAYLQKVGLAHGAGPCS